MGSDRQKQTPPAHTPATPTPHFLQTRPFDLQTSSALENDLEQTLDPQKQTEPSKKFSLSKAPLFPSGTKLPSPPIGQNCVQAKLTMGQPGDPYEQEADQMASQVVQKINVLKSRSPESAVQRQELQEAEDQLQMKPLPTIQRRDLKEEESELQMKSTIQRQGEGTVSADLESTIQGARGSGQLMSDGIRQPMEQAFGADFSSVKIHTDAQSDQLNRSIQAKAFTTGQDVFFRQGAYDPGSQGGQELLAHELTHVVQQNGSAVQRNTIQRKTQNLRPLSSKNVKKLGSFLSLGFYSSKTQDLQAAIGNYNKIETAAKNYDTQAELLKSIYTTAIAWAEEHVNKGDIEGNSATEEVLTAAAQADKEIDAITNQADADGMGFLLDRYRTQFTNKSDKQLAEAEKEEFEEATSLLESSLLEKTEWTVTKHGKSKEKSGKAAKKIDKVDRGFLGDDSLKAIEFLSGRPDGKKWLQSKGFYTADQALILARDPKTTNLWEASKRKIGGPLPLGMGEKLNSIKRLQIATYQRNLGLSDDKFKATPGFLRHLSQEAQAEDKQNARAGKPYKSGKAHDSIYANDTDMWEKTMGSKDPANVSKADKEQNLSIISILQRIFIVLQTGLQYRQKSDDVDFQKWPTSVAVALSHGGRVNIKLPPLKQGENGQDFINWLLGKNTVAKEEGLPGKKTTKSQYDTGVSRGWGSIIVWGTVDLEQSAQRKKDRR